MREKNEKLNEHLRNSSKAEASVAESMVKGHQLLMWLTVHEGNSHSFLNIVLRKLPLFAISASGRFLCFCAFR